MHWWRRRDREQDLERELRSDLELEATEQQQSGLSAEEAHYAAQRVLGKHYLGERGGVRNVALEFSRDDLAGFAFWQSQAAPEPWIYFYGCVDACVRHRGKYRHFQP